MKKFLITSLLVVATGFCAIAQSTIYFPTTGTNSFSSLTVNTGTFNLAPPLEFTRARLIFGVSGFTGFDPGADPAPSIRFDSITLSGQGISGSAVLTGRSVTDNSLQADRATWFSSGFVNISPTSSSWNSSTSVANFTVAIRNGIVAQPGASIFYGVQYGDGGGDNFNTALGNITITAVPEPSTYVAAAGLLGLFLWSAKRHLFKFARPRSTSLGAASNGAA